MTTKPNNDPAREKQAAILGTLASRDNAALLALLADDGSDANWSDDRGQTLLHFAALRGDEDLCDALIWKKGCNVLARNEDGETPARLAAIFGHDTLAQHLFDLERRQLATNLPPAPALTTVADMRREPQMLYFLVCSGHVATVVECAMKNGERFTREDLLAAGQKGESVILRLCQSGQLPALLRPELWADDGAREDLRTVRDSLPLAFKHQIDESGLLPDPAQPRAPQGQQMRTGDTGKRFKLGPK